MGKTTVDTFIQDQFNDNTIDDQILAQKNVISRAEREIVRLTEIRAEQANIPWYRWDGVTFNHFGFYHSDGYRSHHACSDTFKSYEEFVRVIIEAIDPDVQYSGADDSDFIIVSPNGRRHKLESDELRNLPLVKEYFERKDLQATLKKDQKEIEEFDQDINRYAREMEATDKYTEIYIKSLHEEQLKIIQERDEFKAKLESGESLKRLKELNEILRCVDELLED